MLEGGSTVSLVDFVMFDLCVYSCQVWSRAARVHDTQPDQGLQKLPGTFRTGMYCWMVVTYGFVKPVFLEYYSLTNKHSLPYGCSNYHPAESLESHYSV